MEQRNVNSLSAVKETSTKKARAIHDRILVLDSHIDFEPADLTAERNYTQRLPTQFNLPNMIDGGLDALFFVIYVGQTRESQNPDALKAAGYQRAYHAAVEKFAAVHRFASEIAPERIEIAMSAADIRRIHADGKKAALMGVENGYPLGDDLTRVE
ncbi:MAG TPA: membrane dipeptidase, partial [Candidatus Deferrimicrobium sp.]|nr:membrane dipeptidase [Candidatus Deferrimicrobium sp.]